MSRDTVLAQINTTLRTNRRFQTYYIFVLLTEYSYATGHLQRILYRDGVYHVIVGSTHNAGYSVLTFTRFHDFYSQIEKQLLYYQMQEKDTDGRVLAA